jgi:hypothetical protein
MARKRKRKMLRDAIGPQTMRYQAIRDGIKGMRRAADRGACKDATALLRLTEQAMTGITILRTEREHFEDERARINKRCRR